MPWLEDLKFPRGYQMGTHIIKYKLSLDCLDQIRYLTGYAGGIKRKEKLLEIEGIHG